MKSAVTDLTHDLLTLEAESDYAKAKQMLDRYVEVRPALRNMLTLLENIPTDVRLL